VNDAPPAPDDGLLDDLLDEVLEQAVEIATLDAARAEAWGSDVLALAVDELGNSAPLIERLRRLAGPDGAGDPARARSAGVCLAVVASVAGPGDLVGEVPALDPEPDFVGILGTSSCEGAWLLRARAATSVLLRFVDAAEVRHVVSVDLVPGSGSGSDSEGESVGEVMVGPGDLLGVIDESDASVGIDEEAGGADALARRVIRALGATQRPRESAVVNGRVLAQRLQSITGEQAPILTTVAEEIPELEPRDPQDDTFALSVLIRALGETLAPGDDAGDAVDRIAGVVAPDSLQLLPPADRDAVLLLEWADWLGAVIGLVRAGEGSAVDGAALVDHVNRCPEVTSTIPKADRERIAWAFDQLTSDWDELGLTFDGALTPEGVAILPAALRKAWGTSSA
jgi:hypothetical protein